VYTGSPAGQPFQDFDDCRLPLCVLPGLGESGTALLYRLCLADPLPGFVRARFQAEGPRAMAGDILHGSGPGSGGTCCFLTGRESDGDLHVVLSCPQSF